MEENEFLEKLIGGERRRFWIGGHRDRVADIPKDKWNWMWTDGSEWNFTNWMSGEPNNFLQGGEQFSTIKNFIKSNFFKIPACCRGVLRASY